MPAGLLLVTVFGGLISGCGGGGESSAAPTLPAIHVEPLTDAVEAVSEARAVAKDGKIFITGGDRAVGGVSSVQVFDPVTRTFAMHGQMLQRRFVHSATVSSEGRLIIAGGFNYDIGGRFLRTVEEYEPTTGASAPLPELCDARDNHHAVALDGGRIMIIGGDSDEAGYISRVEIYDPDSGPDRCDRHLSVGRVHEAVADPSDGYVYVFGGLSVAPDFSVVYEKSIERVSKTTGQVEPAGSMLRGRKQFEATPLENGSVLITGGFSEGLPIAEAELYDPKTGISVELPAMTIPRAGHGATLLAGGDVLVSGGIGPDGVLQSTELFKLEGKEFVAGPKMRAARSLHVSIGTSDGGVLLSGGYQGSATYTKISGLVQQAAHH